MKHRELEEQYTALKMQSDREAASIGRKLAEAKNAAAEAEVELADTKAALHNLEEYREKADQIKVSEREGKRARWMKRERTRGRERESTRRGGGGGASAYLQRRRQDMERMRPPVTPLVDSGVCP